MAGGAIGAGLGLGAYKLANWAYNKWRGERTPPMESPKVLGNQHSNPFAGRATRDLGSIHTATFANASGLDRNATMHAPYSAAQIRRMKRRAYD